MSIVFGIVKNGFVTNRVVADSLELIEQVVGPDVAFAETKETGIAQVDGRWDGTKFYAPNPDDMPPVEEPTE